MSRHRGEHQNKFSSSLTPERDKRVLVIGFFNYLETIRLSSGNKATVPNHAPRLIEELRNYDTFCRR